MKSITVRYLFTLIIGIVIGILYSNFVPHATSDPSSQKTAKQVSISTSEQPIISAKGIIPTDSLGGIVTNINGDALLVQIADRDDSTIFTKQQIQLFPDTNIQLLDPANPSTIKKIFGGDIQIGQHVQATGKMDSEKGLLSNYIVVTPTETVQ
ncbi:MAG: hypothetical protein Q8P11_04110 [bacterium]|nr:hypothetical protein [bacterium]